MPAAEIVTDLERLGELAPEWDALAAACALPQMSPAWVLAWWRIFRRDLEGAAA